jgi:hypothetical protein
MEILVAILIIALLAAIAFAVRQRRPGGAQRLGGPAASPPGRRRGVGRADPMAAAVAEHARATDPADVVVAEQRLRAQARQVAAGLGAHAAATPATAYDGGAPTAASYGAVPAAAATGPGYGPAASSASYADPHADGAIDPASGRRVDGYDDPKNDPRYNDPRYDGRLAADWVDPRDDDRVR